MSRTLEQRIEAWAKWLAVAQEHHISPASSIVGFAAQHLPVVGYEHSCGMATLIHNWDGYHGECCDGCWRQIPNPESECDPLYKISP